MKFQNCLQVSEITSLLEFSDLTSGALRAIMRALPVAAFAKARVATGTLLSERRRTMEVTHKPLSRGVYWAAATKNGKPEVFATNAAGDEVKRMTLHDYSWKRAEAAIEFLWRFLDMTDPAIELGRTTPVLVLPEPSRAVRSDIYDPYAESGVPGHLREPW